MTPIETDRQKRAAAEAAVAEIEDGMLVGLGTGSTVAFAIAALAWRCRDGLRIEAVATSERSAATARASGITVIPFDQVATVDLAIDGIDEIDDAFRAIKGAGGAMLREKIVASAARLMIAIGDSSKKVKRLGGARLPVEVLPFAHTYVARALLDIGAIPTLRGAEDDPYRTDQGNFVLDCAFGEIDDPAALAARLSPIPGLLGHGLFIDEIDSLYLGTPQGIAKSVRTQQNETN